MKKLTYAQQVKADRKAAAAERKADRAANIETVTQQNARLYAKVEKPAKTRQAAILRRLTGRLENLETIGNGFNDACLFILQALAANFTNESLGNMGQGQNSVVRHLDKVVAEGLGLEWTIFKGINDDDQVEVTTPFGALFIDAEDVDLAKEFINQAVVDYKANR